MLKHFFCASLLAVNILTSAFYLPRPALSQDIQIEAISTKALPRIITKEHRYPTVILFYSSECPRCQKFFPEFLKFMEKYKKRDVNVMLFSLDPKIENLIDFLQPVKSTFNTYWVEPYQQGEMTAALEESGITVGERFYYPFVVIINSDGMIVGQWEALELIDQIKSKLTSLRVYE